MARRGLWLGGGCGPAGAVAQGQETKKERKQLFAKRKALPLRGQSVCEQFLK